MDKITKKAENVTVTVIKPEKDVEKIIYDHVGFSMIAGAIPIPVLDLLAVSAIQLDMIRQLAKKYEIDFDDEIGKSLVSSILSSTIGTSLGRAGASAVKAIPGIGTLLGIGSQVAVSGITTFAVGHLFYNHFSNNQPLKDFNFDTVKVAFDDLLKKGKEFVDDIQKKAKPVEKELKKETAIVIRKMTENGIIKQNDSIKILKAIEEE
jgi:uncharacterized protein (DUF697 family)